MSSSEQAAGGSFSSGSGTTSILEELAQAKDELIRARHTLEQARQQAALKEQALEQTLKDLAKNRQDVAALTARLDKVCKLAAVEDPSRKASRRPDESKEEKAARRKAAQEARKIAEEERRAAEEARQRAQEEEARKRLMDKVLPVLQNCDGLADFSGWRELTDDSAVALAAWLPTTDRCRWLRLKGNCIRDAGAQALAAALAQDHHLLELSIHANPIDSPGLRALVAALSQNSTLEKLIINTCILNSDEEERLKSNPRICFRTYEE